MANIKVNVIDQNNVNIAVTPTPNQVITIDRSATGNGIVSITAVDIDDQTYLDILYTDGSTQQVGPLTTGVYFGVSPITVTGNEISLNNTAVTAGEYGSASQTVTYTVDTKGRLTASQEQSIAILLSQVTDAGVLAGQDTITASQISDAGDPNGVATLDSNGQVPLSQIPALGDLNYQGTWNASTNTPTLTSSVGTKGYYYVVSVAGSTNLNGITDWQINDWAVFNGSVWQKIDNTDLVTSVNGYTGTVVLTTTDVAEGTNEYFTTARARSSVSAGTGISYNSTTGVITNSSPSLGGDVVGPSSATDNAIARYDTTTGKLIQNSGVTVDDNANIAGIRSTQYSGATPATQPIGTMWFDSSTDTLNFQQNAITQQIGEELFVYGKASSAITDSPLQIIYHTGTVGSSGVITFAPTVAGITDENAIIGVATESIALNGFGRITAFGVVHGITTNGSAYGETWADDDVIWYNPVTGNPTNIKPTAPNIKFQIGLVINAGSGGSGSFQVLLQAGTQLGGTDSNVQITTPSAAQLLTYSTASGYWKNTSLSAGTGISVGTATSGVLTVTNSAPDQTVVMTSGTGISVTGTYPNFTVTNTSPSSGGTVTSVSGTAPISSSGGNTPAISISQATTSTDGYLSSTDWNTFNGKQTALVSGSNIKTVNGTSLLGSGDVGTIGISYGGTGQTTANNAFNALAPSQTSNSGKYLKTDGTNTSWATVDALPSQTGHSGQYLTTDGSTASWATVNAGASLSNDTSTASNLYPIFASATSGTPTTIYTSNAKYLYKPSTGELSALAHVSSNGISINNSTVSASYTIASGNNGLSVGPVTVASGQTVTVTSGQRWVIL